MQSQLLLMLLWSAVPNIIRLASAASGLWAIQAGSSVRNALWYYVLLSLVCDGMGFLFSELKWPHWYGNIFLLGEFLLLGGYLLYHTTSLKYRRAGQAMLAAIAIVFIVHTLRHSYVNVNFKGGAALYGLLIPLTLLGFYRIITDVRDVRIERSPFFIFCAGLLLYVSGNFMIMLYEGPLHVTDRTLLRNLWNLHNILNLLKNVTIGYSLYLLNLQRR